MNALLLVVALAIQDPPKSITFSPPKDAKPADVEKAAKAMEKRCSDYGYKGVKAKVENGEVVLSCESGVTSAMQPRIKELATRAYSKVEFMLGYPLSEQEREQYEPGKTAPKGASWFNFPDGRPGLVIDSSKAVIGGRILWKPNEKNDMRTDSAEPFLEFDEGLSRLIKAQADEHKRVVIYVMVDGAMIKNVGVVRWRPVGNKGDSYLAQWVCQEAKDKIGGICLNNPLPFALEKK